VHADQPSQIIDLAAYKSLLSLNKSIARTATRAELVAESRYKPVAFVGDRVELDNGIRATVIEQRQQSDFLIIADGGAHRRVAARQIARNVSRA
jgi:hypothetical protein